MMFASLPYKCFEERIGFTSALVHGSYSGPIRDRNYSWTPPPGAVEAAALQHIQWQLAVLLAAGLDDSARTERAQLLSLRITTVEEALKADDALTAAALFDKGYAEDVLPDRYIAAIRSGHTPPFEATFWEH